MTEVDWSLVISSLSTRLRPSLTYAVDLHPPVFVTDSGSIVSAALDHAIRNSLVRVLFIHGKGRGVMKAVIQRELRQREVSFSEDRDGGSTLAYLQEPHGPDVFVCSLIGVPESDYEQVMRSALVTAYTFCSDSVHFFLGDTNGKDNRRRMPRVAHVLRQVLQVPKSRSQCCSNASRAIVEFRSAARPQRHK